MRVAIVMTDGFDDREFRQPVDLLLAAGHHVAVVGLNPGATIVGKMGLESVQTDLDVASVRSDDFDAVLIPGGHSPDRLRIVPAAVDFVARMHGAGKPTAAICHGPWLLIEAGVVRGRSLTGWASVRTDVVNAGGVWIDAPVVMDGNLLTSRRPGDLPEFGAALLSVLEV